jgi:hypothetical protein
MVIPQYLVILLPLIVSAASGWFTEVKLPSWANAIITGIIVLVSALAWALLGQKLSGDLVANFVVVASYCAALVAGPLRPLEQYLQIKLPSPLKALAAKADATIQAQVPQVALATISSAPNVPSTIPVPTGAMPAPVQSADAAQQPEPQTQPNS